MTVWWPQPITPHDGGREGSASQSKAATVPSVRHLSARAERLRHTSGVTGVQWSPGGSLDHTSPQVLLSSGVSSSAHLPTSRLSIAVGGSPNAQYCALSFILLMECGIAGRFTQTSSL